MSASKALELLRVVNLLRRAPGAVPDDIIQESEDDLDEFDIVRGYLRRLDGPDVGALQPGERLTAGYRTRNPHHDPKTGMFTSGVRK